VKPEDLFSIRYAVCAIGWIGTSSDEYYADPTRGKFEIEGTGFLIEPRVVHTCDHVVEALERQRKRRRGKPFGSAAQFFYPDASHSDEWTTAVRPFEIVHREPRVNLALLRLTNRMDVAPLTLVSHEYVPLVGEGVGLCGYAHGSILMTRGGEVERVGPLVQTGIISALSPFDIARPERAVLDLVTGPAASGSPIFRLQTGEVIGFLIEGQIKSHAAFSMAQLIYRDANGVAIAPLMTDLIATTAVRRPPTAQGQHKAIKSGPSAS